MDDKIIATFCLCDDLLQAIHHQEDRQCQMNDAEIMTTAFIAALFFRGNHESARAMLQQHGYIPHMVSKSRFSRRLHRIKDLFIILFDLLGQIWKTLNTDSIYVIDSLPIAVCDNIRIRRSKIYSDENFRGYQARALVPFRVTQVFVLHLCHFLHQEDLMEREAMVQNP